ncbi:MAG: hypothetical protein CMP48_19545 [Rickettsiales bacterium]|nr:hypothetical protein [Rickettsiales bacterium]
MKSILTILFVSIATVSFGQFNLNFYQMQGATPQNMNYNPAIFPKAKAFVSLPGMSGIDISVNNSFGVSDIFTETGDSTLIDINRFLSNQKEGAYLNTNMNITDLMFGFRTGENGFVSFFVNERVDATIFYPFKLVDFLWQGNAEYLGEEYLIDDITYDFTHYREIGVGYGRTFNLFGFNVDLGARLKLLNGTLHGSIKDNLGMSIYTDDNDYSMTVTMQNGLSRSAGFQALEDEDFGYLGFNKNTGFGIDLGGQLELTDKITVGISAVDLGFITWSEYAETASFNGASFEISGSTFDNMDQLADALLDSIESLSIDTVAGKFTTTLNSKLFLNGSYKVTRGGYATAIISNYFTQGKMKSAFGIGYTQELGKWLTASATFSAASQYGADMGLGLMLRGGFFQIYTSVDHLFGTINVPEASGLNAKIGVNFLFGDPDKVKSKK